VKIGKINNIWQEFEGMVKVIRIFKKETYNLPGLEEM
jgi:hypothetical protein